MNNSLFTNQLATVPILQRHLQKVQSQFGFKYTFGPSPSCTVQDLVQEALQTKDRIHNEYQQPQQFDDIVCRSSAVRHFCIHGIAKCALKPPMLSDSELCPFNCHQTQAESPDDNQKQSKNEAPKSPIGPPPIKRKKILGVKFNIQQRLEELNQNIQTRDAGEFRSSPKGNCISNGKPFAFIQQESVIIPATQSPSAAENNQIEQTLKSVSKSESPLKDIPTLLAQNNNHSKILQNQNRTLQSNTAATILCLSVSVDKTKTKEDGQRPDDKSDIKAESTLGKRCPSQMIFNTEEKNKIQKFD